VFAKHPLVRTQHTCKMDNFFSWRGDNPFVQFAASALDAGQAGAQQFMRDVVPDSVQEGPKGPPPASKKALRQLPTVVVSPEDLVDDNNRECCICLEPNRLKDRVVRLPCAHIFHQECISDWLSRHCTCPVCRYELETEDQEYERLRKKRMASRKPRIHSYELERMSLEELRAYIQFVVGKRNYSMPSRRHLASKEACMAWLKRSGRVDIVASPKPVEYSLSQLRSMGVGKLKKCMAEAGVFYDPKDVVEKEDMVQIFRNSGRLVVLPEPDTKPAPSIVVETVSEDFAAPKIPDNVPVTRMFGNMENEEQKQRPEPMDVDGAYTTAAKTLSTRSMWQELFASYGIGDLRALARRLHVDLSDCIERKEMVERLVVCAENAFRSWSISTLRAMATAVHVDLSFCYSRDEMVGALIQPQMAPYLGALLPLAEMSVSELRAQARQWKVEVSDCLEKEEIINRLVVSAIPASG